jgi:hypothetical protein
MITTVVALYHHCKRHAPFYDFIYTTFREYQSSDDYPLVGIKLTDYLMVSILATYSECRHTKFDSKWHLLTHSEALQPWRAQAAVNTVPEPDLVYLRRRWLTCCHNTFCRVSLIQQPKPSGSEAGEYHGWETERRKFDRQSISLMLCRVVLHAVSLWHGTDGFTSRPKEVRARDFYHP